MTTLNLTMFDTIEHVKGQLQYLTGVPAYSMTLFLNGRIMDIPYIGNYHKEINGGTIVMVRV